MSVEYDIVGPSGEGKITPDKILAQMQNNGINAIDVTADGTMVRMQDDQGTFNVPINDVLQHHGMQVKGMTPTNADYSQVSPAHRAAIEAIQDEDLKRVYLESALKKQGVKNPQIMGNGRDFFYFDPQFGKYVALTNNPEWDMSDVAEAGVAAPRVVGSLVGGAMGAAAGNIPGGMAGAAAGGALGNVAAQGLVGYFNPDAGEVMSQNLGTMAKHGAVNAAVDAAAFGIPAGAGKLLGPMAEKGLISSAAKGLGSGMETAGRAVGKVAGALDNPVGQNLASSFIPGAAEASTAGIVGQLPGQAIRGASRGLGWLGEREGLNSVAPELSASLRRVSQNLVKRSPTNVGPSGTERVASFLGGKSPQARSIATSEDILGNAGEMIGGRSGMRRGIMDLYKAGRDIGQNRQEALGAAKAMYAEKAAGVQKAGNIGRTLGRGVQSVEDIGRGLEGVGNTIAATALKGARAGGYVTGKVGQAVKAAGTVGQPIENKLLTRYGAEEAYNRMKPKRPWQIGADQDTINSVLASSDY
jgi:hypothetical protein